MSFSCSAATSSPFPCASRLPGRRGRTLLEVVLHRLRPQDLALPDGMGLQPGSITVTPEGLTIGFVPKPLS